MVNKKLYKNIDWGFFSGIIIISILLLIWGIRAVYFGVIDITNITPGNEFLLPIYLFSIAIHLFVIFVAYHLIRLRNWARIATYILLALFFLILLIAEGYIGIGEYPGPFGFFDWISSILIIVFAIFLSIKRVRRLFR